MSPLSLDTVTLQDTVDAEIKAKVQAFQRDAQTINGNLLKVGILYPNTLLLVLPLRCMLELVLFLAQL